MRHFLICSFVFNGSTSVVASWLLGPSKPKWAAKLIKSIGFAHFSLFLHKIICYEAHHRRWFYQNGMDSHGGS